MRLRTLGHFFVGFIFSSCVISCNQVYYIDTDEIPGFFLLQKKIISSSRAVKILFLSFTCEDIGVAMEFFSSSLEF